MNTRKRIIGLVVAGSIAVGTFGAGVAVGAQSGDRIRFRSNDGRVIVVKDPRGGFLSAEDVATLKLTDYVGDHKAIYRVVYP